MTDMATGGTAPGAPAAPGLDRAAGQDAAPDAVPVRFDGQAGEWFGIWIVNLLLSIVTLGIYSAWAKVRRNRYFYGNTTIGGRRFDYHATGGQILKGRLIVIAALAVLNVVSAVFPPALIAIYAVLIPLVPWLLIRATKFSARNTSWSNVRFDFHGRYGDAFVTFVLLPLGVLATLGTTLPFLTRRINRFTVNGHSLGRHRFEMSAPIGGFYMAFAIALAVTVGIAAVLGVLGWLTLSGVALPTEATQEDAVGLGVVLGLYAFFFLALLPASIIYRAMVRNLVYAATALEGGHRFASTVAPGRLLWIAVTNALATVATVGLALPWAQIRMARYLASNTAVIPNGPLDDFAGRVERDQSAIGDAFADIEGFDIGAAAI